jgi:hypothetical protein
MSDIRSFVDTVSTVTEKVILEDDDGNRVSAKSLLGAVYTVEWKTIYCYCDKDISGIILPWII